MEHTSINTNFMFKEFLTAPYAVLFACICTRSTQTATAESHSPFLFNCRLVTNIQLVEMHVLNKNGS